MISDELRKEFLTIIGKTYDHYGYPEYCGWVEGLLQLENKEWSQTSISERLTEIFPASKYPTSVPSINRALKILEEYGVVEKTGSRKTGYRYSAITSSNLVTSMVYQLMTVNNDFIGKLELLAAKNKKKDTELKRATSNQINMARQWNRALSHLLEATSSDNGD
jgi:DNA-binding transcriptional regulator GbsR (MarR family)